MNKTHTDLKAARRDLIDEDSDDVGLHSAVQDLVPVNRAGGYAHRSRFIRDFTSDVEHTDSATPSDRAFEKTGVPPHWRLEQLVAYHEGALAAGERKVVEKHLAYCSRCADFLLDLQDFDADVARGDAGPESLRQQAWSSFVRQLWSG